MRFHCCSLSPAIPHDGELGHTVTPLHHSGHLSWHLRQQARACPNGRIYFSCTVGAVADRELGNRGVTGALELNLQVKSRHYGRASPPSPPHLSRRLGWLMLDAEQKANGTLLPFRRAGCCQLRVPSSGISSKWSRCSHGVLLMQAHAAICQDTSWPPLIGPCPTRHRPEPTETHTTHRFTASTPHHGLDHFNCG